MSEEKPRREATRVLRMKQVQDRLGLGRSTIYDRMDLRSPRYDSTFPRPIRLGVAAVGWIEAEINAWIDSKIAAGWCGRSEASSTEDRIRHSPKNNSQKK